MTKAKKAILRSGLKQCHIAELIGINTTLLSMYVNGHRKMPRDVARALASVLRTKISTVV